MAGESTRLTLVRPPTTTSSGAPGGVTPPASGSFSEILPVADSLTQGPTPDKRLAGVTGPRPFTFPSALKGRDLVAEKKAHDVMDAFVRMVFSDNPEKA